MMYDIRFTTKFQKDLKSLQKSGKNIEKIFKIIELLANNQPLEAKHRDHALHGDMEGYRECHVEPDLLLIYKIDNDELVLYLVRAGSHSNLFG